MSWTLAEGKCIPGTSGTSPVIFATAHISMEDFVVSRKELYIRGLRLLRSICSGVRPYSMRAWSGVKVPEFVPVLGTLARRDDVEPHAHRPVDKLLDDGRLVAVGRRVHDACAVGHFLENWAYEHVGLDRYHDHVLARHDGVEGVLRPDIGVARRLDDHVHLCLNRDARILGRDATPLGQGVVGLAHVVQPDRRNAWFPLMGQRIGRTADIEVADDGGLHPGGARKLRYHHRPEAPAPDHGYANRRPFFVAGHQLLSHKLHEPPLRCDTPTYATTGYFSTFGKSPQACLR